MAVKFFYLSLVFLLSCAACFIIPFVRQKVAVAMVLALSSITLYGQLGAYNDMHEYYGPAQTSARKKFSQTRHLMAQVKKQEFRLRLRLEQAPNDGGAYWALGEIYELKEELSKAAIAYKKSYELDLGNLNILARYLSVKAKSMRGRLDPLDRVWALRLLAKIPAHPMALNLLALDCYLDKNYGAAILYWSKLQQTVPKDSKIYSELSRLILEAKLKVADLKKRL